MTEDNLDAENQTWIDELEDFSRREAAKDSCPTCHYPTKNGTLRAENAELRAKLKIAVEALKSGVRYGSKCHCQGYDVNNHRGYGLSDDIVIPLEEALSKLHEEEKRICSWPGCTMNVFPHEHRTQYDKEKEK